MSGLRTATGKTKLGAGFWGAWGLMCGVMIGMIVVLGAWSLVQGWAPEFSDIRTVAFMAIATLVPVPFYAARGKRARIDRAD